MSIQRVFLDWQKPALAGAAENLRSRFARDGELDLNKVIIVVPAGRAARRLLEILVALADEQHLVLTPPDIVTPDQFPERLYQPKFQFATPLVQQLAWVAALKALKPAQLKPFLPYPPEENDTPRWLAIGQSLVKLHTELAADGMDCTHVLKAAQAIDGFLEHDRWKVLCELQRKYLDALDRQQLWDIQTARLVAIERREIATEKKIVLIGMADLNRAQRLMLDQIAARVTAIVVAPRDFADRFDEHGCLIPGKWTDAELPLADEQIERVDGPADQAEAVTRWLASLGGEYRSDQIAIGLPDPRLVPQIERQLAQSGATARWAIGRQLSDTGPYRLLKAAADYATRRSFRDLAALVRHPDVTAWLVERLNVKGKPVLDIFTALDRFATEQLPAALDAERLARDEESADVLDISRSVEELIKPLPADAQPISRWAQRFRDVLLTIYGSKELNRDEPAERFLFTALERMRDGLDSLGKVPRELEPAVTARQACGILLEGLSHEGIAPPANPEAIELLGWLDLPLDDAPALIVTTFNERFVPSAAGSDVFLPNRLREALGLLHNDRRLARDAYALSVLLASRAKLRLIVGHRDPEGNPLAPSRLLFAANTDAVVRRAMWMFGDLPAASPRRNLLAPNASRQSFPSAPRPGRLKAPLAELSVTKFRDYIACPYRFYLRHVLKLEPLNDEAAELDGGAFGHLMHYVLEQFGRAEDAKNARVATDPKKIVDYLEFQLDRIAGGRYGVKHVRPAVRVQIEQARLRLRAFAEWQAVRSRDGWRIVFSEDSEDRKRVLKAPFPVDGQPFVLRGRIDRIDYHEETGRLCVLDYKTADAGEQPEKVHRRAGQWIDLQMPLYRHFVGKANLAVKVRAGAAIDLGYVLLPRDLNGVGLALATWTKEELDEADEKAREIIRHIRAERFWPPICPPPLFSEDFAAICQDHRMGKPPLGAEGGAP
jgi:RecB family exonuclease